MSWVEATLWWYSVLLALTIGWAPWVRLLCDRLPDRGATIVRPLALLATVYPAWVLSSTGWVPFSAPLLWATSAIGAVTGWGVLIAARRLDRAWLGSLLAAELLSLVAFAGYVWLRGYTPEILHTEKPMDAAFLMSSSITTTMPPPDPWFAGAPINYYYLGYLIQGSLARLADVPGTTGFNLALATTFSAAITAAAGVGWNVVRGWYSRRMALTAAVLAATLVMLVGNLYAVLQFGQTPEETLAAGWWDKTFGVGWRASRIVCDTVRVRNDCDSPYETINEFPSFSFILGDLHPHVLALPFVLSALGLALNLLLRRRAMPERLGNGDWLLIGVTGGTTGSLYALNSWDFPTYLLITAIAVWWGTDGRWRPVAALVAAAIAAWLPFYGNFVTPIGSGVEFLPAPIQSLPVLPRLFGIIGLHTGERTSIGEFLTIFGLPYALGLWLLGSWWLRARFGVQRQMVPRWAAVSAVVTTILAIVLAAPLIVVCGVPLIVALTLLGGRPPLTARTISAALFALGLALVLGTEFVYIQDVFQSRMNTLFKFYYQVWTLLAVAGATAVVVVWHEARPRVPFRPLLLGLTTVGIGAGLVYPVLSARQWTGDFDEWSGLDGIAYLAQYSTDELAAIRWLQANASPDDILLEAAGCSYQVNGAIPLNRAAAFSGVPTVIGWGWHERQWRLGSPEELEEIPRRAVDVAEIFANPSGELADRYGVTLLYVGRYEREDWRQICDVAGPYPEVSEPGYPGPGWEPAFEQGEVTIYRRLSGEASASSSARR